MGKGLRRALSLGNSSRFSGGRRALLADGLPMWSGSALLPSSPPRFHGGSHPGTLLNLPRKRLAGGPSVSLAQRWEEPERGAARDGNRPAHSPTVDRKKLLRNLPLLPGNGRPPVSVSGNRAGHAQSSRLTSQVLRIENRNPGRRGRPASGPPVWVWCCFREGIEDTSWLNSPMVSCGKPHVWKSSMQAG